MGAVYEVEHTQLGVHYALKSFTLEDGHVDVLKNKFLAEGKILARLHDPHLVRVFDLNFDEATGTPYFVMDLVLSEDGKPRTLVDVKTAELDEDCVLGWFADLASALDYIHEQGIVHRDIKLGNVLLSSNRHVVLSDFGISRIFSERLRSDVKAVNTIVSEATTATRLVMGTRGYMAPEVIWGGEATPAADVYSLGVMFLYLLTGLWYAPGTKALELLDGFKYRWRDVLSRMLSVNPLERPLPLSDLPRQLQPVESTGESLPTQTKEPTSRFAFVKRRWFIAIAIIAVAAIAVGVIVTLRSKINELPSPAQDDFNKLPSPAQDDFGEIFSASDVFRPKEGGK